MLWLTLLLSDSLAELLADTYPDALILSEFLSESRSDALALILFAALEFEILSEPILLLTLCELDKLVDLLVLALPDSLCKLPLCDADSDAASAD